MKRAVAMLMLVALALGFGVSALAKGGPPTQCPDPTHDCEIRWKCFEYGCYYAKCCTDCVWVYKKGECVPKCETICTPIF
jgi:hypothetical protein